MITGVVLARNEEQNIVPCLQSLRPHVSELILIDMESSDQTASLAKPYIDHLLHHEQAPNFDSARNLAIDAAKNHWLWFVDADERVSPQVADVVHRLIKEQGDQFEAINIPFKTYFCGKWIEHSGWWPGYTMPRVLKKGYFQFSRRLHGGVELSGREIRLPPDPALGIEHFSYLSIEHYLEKLNRYTSTEAQQLADAGQSPDWRNGVGHMVHDLWMYYEANQGVLDQRQGWLLAWLSGQYRWLSHAKLIDKARPATESLPQSFPQSLDEVLDVMLMELERARVNRPVLPLGVVFRSPVYDPSGYADEGRCIVKSMARGNRRLRLEAIPWSDTPCALSADDRALLNTLSLVDRRGSSIAITNCIPTLVKPDPAAAINVLRTTFETDRLPEGWLERIDEFDEVWVISRHNELAFRRSGVAPEKMRVVPSLLDEQRFGTNGATFELPEALRDRFCFLSVFDWQLRKGWDVLLRAYVQAFPEPNEVGLYLKISRAHGVSMQDCRAQANAVLAAYGTDLSKRADIVISDDNLTADELVSLYRASDAFVLASRGEGWGRPITEAMALGKPVIGTGASGSIDFLTDENAILLPAEEVDVPEVAAREIPPYLGHRWFEPDEAALVTALQRLSHDAELRAQLGERACRDIREQFGLDAGGQRFLTEIDRLERGFSIPDFPAPRAEQIRVVWEGEYLASHSFSNINEALIPKFANDERFAIAIDRRIHNPPRQERSERSALLDGLAKRQLQDRAHVRIRHAFPPNWEPSDAGRWIHIQPWEYGHLPQAWIEPLRNAVDEIWAPSTYVRDVFVASGIDEDKIHVVPWGVDADVYTPEAPARLLPTSKTFRFVFVGGTLERKGYDRLLQAYREEFGPEDDVCLVVKDLGTQTFYRYGNLQDQTLEARDDPSAPEFVYFEDDWTPGQLASLYTACDCLVMPYRGEGFGLPILEAMACGLPAIVPKDGASRDFVNETNGLLLDSQFVETTHSWPLVGPAEELEVDIQQLKERMRFAYEHRDEVRRLGQQAAVDVSQNFTWEQTYRKMAERLVVNAQLAEQKFRADAFGKLAAIVHTNDSESTIAECLARLKPFVDQILVVDGASQDRTCQIASEYGAHVIDNAIESGPLDPLTQLNCEWCFSLDGSVQLAEDDAEQLRQLVEVQPAVAREVTVQLAESTSSRNPVPEALRIQRLGKRPQVK